MYKNDYELIYLYRTSRSDDALALIIQKYRPLIFKNIHKFYIKQKDHDDFYQESILVLLECINNFDESRNKTFTKYFELVLFRRFIQLKNKTPKYILFEKPELFEGSFTEEIIIIKEDNIYLAPFEKEVYHRYFKQHQTIDYIAESLNKSNKSIKNAIYRIKVKIKDEI
ncbi:sigma factor [Acholeplasma granularum]|uniref:sigma factor n=1 Tax=Acholeplasma granularum TaxID=264635 RepID=UPI0004ADE4B2|nr:sigma factor [Acholeplasma granularum]